LKIEIVRNIEGDNPVSEIIELNGNIIMPYHLSVVSMEHTPEGLKLHVTREYTTRTSYNMDGNKLWIMGSDKVIEETNLI